MKIIKTISLIVLLITTSANLLAQTGIEGRWKEYWGTGNLTDIEYNDIFIITYSANKLYINCENRDNYHIRKVVFDGEELSFEVLNTNENDVIPYLLKLNSDGNWLRGTAISIKGKDVNVKWERIIDK